MRWVREVDEHFHARFSATARRYRYVIYNHNYRPAILGQGVSHYHEAIDATLMHQAGQSLLGSTTSAPSGLSPVSPTPLAQCDPPVCQPFRPLHRARHQGQRLPASHGAQHHRLPAAGGAGLQPVQWIAEVLAAKDRNLAGPTAKAGGLYLVDVDYPAEFGLPGRPRPAVAAGLGTGYDQF